MLCITLPETKDQPTAEVVRGTGDDDAAIVKECEDDLHKERRKDGVYFKVVSETSSAPFLHY